MQQSTARPALLAAAISRLSEAPVVALLGARQVGKTTLAEQVASAWSGPSTVFDLEVATVREAMSGTPERLLRQSEDLVVLDEVQRMPGLFEVLRPIGDDRNRKAVFLLLGSASWDLIKGISETLAGRILFVDVGGFSLAEVGPESEPTLDARRFSPSLAGAAGMDSLDAVVHAHVSGVGHSGSGFESISRSLETLLEDAGALSQAAPERFGVGAIDGRERDGGEPLPRPAGWRLHDLGAAALVREPRQAHRQVL